MERAKDIPALKHFEKLLEDLVPDPECREKLRAEFAKYIDLKIADHFRREL